MRWVEGGSIDGQERSRVGGGGREDPRREGRAGLHPDGDRGKISKARNRRNRAASRMTHAGKITPAKCRFISWRRGAAGEGCPRGMGSHGCSDASARRCRVRNAMDCGNRVEPRRARSSIAPRQRAIRTCGGVRVPSRKKGISKNQKTHLRGEAAAEIQDELRDAANLETLVGEIPVQADAHRDALLPEVKEEHGSEPACLESLAVHHRQHQEKGQLQEPDGVEGQTRELDEVEARILGQSGFGERLGLRRLDGGWGYTHRDLPALSPRAAPRSVPRTCVCSVRKSAQ